PKILVECKAPQVKLTQTTFEQTARYNSIIGAKEIVLTNGLQHIHAYFENGEYLFYKP
uniref:type I restriction enzyme HsdR N-terminal domain-containing protein n=1 Tax=uncultured Chryseobacterium sp. TaxID=259322 RepID=UPI0025F3904B